jgi:release factor glutamine methyltransferase
MVSPSLPVLPIEDSPLTVKECLAWAGAFLERHGIPDGRLSAEVILGSILGLDRVGLLLQGDQLLKERHWQAFQKKIFRRAIHEPVAYLVGEKEFWSLTFDVNPDVLIPRPETELLVEEGLSIIEADHDLKHIVELGTGSGAITIALAKSVPPERSFCFVATDRSAPALRTAGTNTRRHGVQDKIALVQGDWLSPFSNRHRWIDFLVANPPYISSEEMAGLPVTVKDYEPLQALEGGLDGLGSIRTILSQAKGQLKLGGWLLMEIGELQGGKVLQVASQNKFSPASIMKDDASKDRVLKARFHG